MEIQEVIAQLQEAQEKFGPHAIVQIEQVLDRDKDDSYGRTFGLVIGTTKNKFGEVAEREQAVGFMEGCTNAVNRVKELDRYIELGYFGE